jgi:hypothetical protein
VFISHAGEDKRLATLFKSLIAEVSGDKIACFQSTDTISIQHGSKWFELILGAVRRSSMVLVLLTPNSIRKRWINIETGMAMAAGTRIIAPVALCGLSLGEIPEPWRERQFVNLRKEHDARRFAEMLRSLGCVVSSEQLRTFRGDLAQMEQTSAALDVLERLTKGLEGRPETKRIVLDQITLGNRMCCENVPMEVVVELRKLMRFLSNNQVFDTYEIRSSPSDDEKFEVTVRLSASLRPRVADILSEHTDEPEQE